MAQFNVGINIQVLSNASRQLQAIGAQFDNMDRKVRRLNQSFRQMQGYATAIGAGALVLMGRNVVQTTADFQGLVVRLSNVEGGIKNARTQIEKLNKVFGASSFSVNKMADNFTKLRAAGLGTDEANRLLRQGAEAVAAFGGNTNELNRLMIGMTQAIGKGTLSMEEMRQQIGEAVPAAMRELAAAYDVSVSEMFKMIETGAVNSREAMIRLGNQFEESFGGSIAAQAATVGGAMFAMSNAIDLAIGNFTTFNTDAGGQMVVVLRRITDGMTAFIDSISQDTVDRFFRIINNLLTIFQALSPAIGIVVDGVLRLAEAFTTILANPIYSYALFGGAIGYALWGRWGGSIAALTGATAGYFSQILGGFDKIYEKVKQFDTPGFRSLLAAITGAAGGATVGSVLGAPGRAGGAVIGGLVGGLTQAAKEAGLLTNEFKEQAQQIQSLNRRAAEYIEFVDGATVETADKLETLRQRSETSTFGFGSNTAKRFEQQLEKVDAQIEKLQLRLAIPPSEISKFNEDNTKNYRRALKELEGLNNTVKEVRGNISKGVQEGVNKFASATERSAVAAESALKRLQASVSNDPIAEKTLQLDARTEQLSASLDKLREKYRALGDSEGLARVDAIQKSINEARERGVANIHAEVGAQNAANVASERALQLSIQRQMVDLQRQTGGAFSGMFQSRFAEQAEDRQLQLKESIAQVNEQIAAKEEEMRTASGQRRIEIGRTLSLLEQFNAQQGDALDKVSAAGLLAQDTWKRVGDAIEGSLKSALKDLIKGTFDAEKALLAFYDKITDAAIDYLFELIKIQFRQQIIASLAPLTGGGGGAGLFGMFLGGFANGGAFRGGVTPFADGGIVRGPTMFGLAGENGDEAILPLERIGGKLGVNAVGGDGGSYNITIQAIDTQTGAQFLQRNAQTIVQQLRQQDRLNRGIGSVR